MSITNLNDPALDEEGAPDDTEPCGENMCHCNHLPRHGPCGCDCPRSYDTSDEDGQDW